MQRQTHAAQQCMLCRLYQLIHPMCRAARPAPQSTGHTSESGRGCTPSARPVAVRRETRPSARP
eukprot:13431382-Alexandrium_andersonii.AAC.1